MSSWIKLYEQVPPLNEYVELKVIVNGEERIYINKLIPMMNGSYVFQLCDYDDYEVVCWRKRQMKCYMNDCINNDEWACMYRSDCDYCSNDCKHYYQCLSCDYYMGQDMEV